MISIRPGVRGGQVLDLPETKGHESHEAEPETLVDGVESDSVDEDFLEESTDIVKPVDSFVFKE